MLLIQRYKNPATNGTGLRYIYTHPHKSRVFFGTKKGELKLLPLDIAYAVECVENGKWYKH